MRIAIQLAGAALMLSACGSDNQDRLDDNMVEGTPAANSKSAVDSRCGSIDTVAAVKRELFRRAAEIRGSNEANYARIAEFALLTIDDAAAVSPAGPEQAVDCIGRAQLRLPRNLGVAGGRTSLEGRIGYSVGKASGGGAPVVSMSDDDRITVPLATLSQRGSAAASTPAPSPTNAEADPLSPAPAPERERERDVVERRDPAPTAVRPSFNCARARTRSERAVCASPSLASLDRAMASQFDAAMRAAEDSHASLLIETRDAFLGYRERCTTDACIANVYRGRMREIDDIMTGRWRPTR